MIRVGSRESKLAVAQTMILIRELEAAHPELSFELVTMKTTGDQILDKPLDQIGGKGLFVRELDRALEDGTVELTVHSLKDMPMEQPDGYPIVAYAERGEAERCAGMEERGTGAGKKTSDRNLQCKTAASVTEAVSECGVSSASGKCPHQTSEAGRGTV